MRKHILICMAFFGAILTGIAGCSDSTRPEDDLGVVLKLSAETRTSDGQDFFVAVIEVENLGQTKINYPAGCGFLVGLTVEDAERRSLTIWDPALLPECPPVHHVC